MTRVDGRIAYVDDDGFERPVPVNELVVVLPAGHKPSSGARLLFDQQAYDTGRTSKRNKPEPSAAPAAISSAAEQPVPQPEEDFPIEETEYGNSLSVSIAFEPADIHKLDTTTFNVALVNDSNYFLRYQLLAASEARGEWTIFASGEVAPNEIADLRRITRQELPQTERLVFQAIAFKKDKPFAIKEPISVSRKVDQTKFFKYHCFTPGLYFDSPVLELPLLAEPTPRKKTRKENTGNR